MLKKNFRDPILHTNKINFIFSTGLSMKLKTLLCVAEEYEDDQVDEMGHKRNKRITKKIKLRFFIHMGLCYAFLSL